MSTTGSKSSPLLPGLCSLAQSPSLRNRENSIPGVWNPLGPPRWGRCLQRGFRGNFDREAPPSHDAELSAHDDKVIFRFSLAIFSRHEVSEWNASGGSTSFDSGLVTSEESLTRY